MVYLIKCKLDLVVWVLHTWDGHTQSVFCDFVVCWTCRRWCQCFLTVKTSFVPSQQYCLYYVGGVCRLLLVWHGRGETELCFPDRFLSQWIGTLYNEILQVWHRRGETELCFLYRFLPNWIGTLYECLHWYNCHGWLCIKHQLSILCEC